MDKTDTLQHSNARSALQELLTRPRPVVPHIGRRRTDPPPQPEPAPGLPDQNLYESTYSDVVLEPAPLRQPYDLSYAFLLIPRFSAHYLIGDIAEDLHEWMRRICISFDWRLDGILVRPEYMQWVIYVPANTPPSRCIRTIREQTSRLIFADFPHIQNENLSKDFWAPGYSVLLGPTPHPPEMISEYIRLTRQQQGIQPRLGH